MRVTTDGQLRLIHQERLPLDDHWKIYQMSQMAVALALLVSLATTSDALPEVVAARVLTAAIR
jgi:hypothetical protein